MTKNNNSKRTLNLKVKINKPTKKHTPYASPTKLNPCPEVLPKKEADLKKSSKTTTNLSRRKANNSPAKTVSKNKLHKLYESSLNWKTEN
jgi:hypothetical protein